MTKIFEYAKADLEKGIEEMGPALQKVLSVDCVDGNSMFNRNSGSDELRYMKFVAEFLTSLEYFIYNIDHS